MNKYWLLSLCLSLVGLPLVACAPPAALVPEPKTPATSDQGSVAPWEQKWANIQAEGKKEGAVTVYASAWAVETRIALTEAFKKKFGIGLEFAVFGRGSEMSARVEKEKLAGLKIVDIIAVGASNLISEMKPAALLGDLEPLLLLPDVTDAKVWGGRIPFIDKDKKMMALIAVPHRSVVYNTDLVKKGEITSYKDLLKPQYKGKIIMIDPSIPGAGNLMMGFLAVFAWRPEESADFLRQLISQQDVILTPDVRLQMETVAKGKYAISLGGQPAMLNEFLAAGTPLDIAFPREGALGTSVSGTIAVSAAMANPKAGSVFTNWLLTKEGQTIFSRNQAGPSIRTDVAPVGIDARLLPQPGEKIFLESEESILFRSGPEFRDTLIQVIRQAQK